MGNSQNSHEIMQERMLDKISDQLVDIQILQRRTKKLSLKNQKKCEELLKKVQDALKKGEDDRAQAMAQAAAVRHKRAIDLAYTDAALESVRVTAENCIQEHITNSSIQYLTHELSQLSATNNIDAAVHLLKPSSETETETEAENGTDSIIEWVKANSDSAGNGHVPAPPAVPVSELFEKSNEAREEKILLDNKHRQEAMLLEVSLPITPKFDPMSKDQPPSPSP